MLTLFGEQIVYKFVVHSVVFRHIMPNLKAVALKLRPQLKKMYEKREVKYLSNQLESVSDFWQIHGV